MNTANRAVLVTGNPFDGLSITGPFPTHEDAFLAADNTGEDEWWAVTLNDTHTDGQWVSLTGNPADGFAIHGPYLEPPTTGLLPEGPRWNIALNTPQEN